MSEIIEGVQFSFAVFENSEKMILVMEYCSGGELYDYLSQKKVLQEDEARRLVYGPWMDTVF